MDESIEELLDDSCQISEKVYILDVKVDPGQAPLRIDKYIMLKLSDASRTKIQTAVTEGLVTVNNKVIKPNYKVRAKDHILVEDTRDPLSMDILPEDIMPPIVFEDENLLVVNKPAGLVVHPGIGNRNGTLLNGLAYYFVQHPYNNMLNRFGLLHRIDKNTSGLLVIAKSELGLRDLQKQFFNHTIERKYTALVWGDVEEDEGTINKNIGRHPRFPKLFTTFEDETIGKQAITHYKVLERFGYVTMIECKLETGRTHQIRVHMKSIGHTLFNDDRYGGDGILKGTVYSKYKSFVENCFKILNRQALHARTLGFIHPKTGEYVHFEAPLTQDFEQVLEKWRIYSKAKGFQD